MRIEFVDFNGDLSSIEIGLKNETRLKSKEFIDFMIKALNLQTVTFHLWLVRKPKGENEEETNRSVTETDTLGDIEGQWNVGYAITGSTQIKSMKRHCYLCTSYYDLSFHKLTTTQKKLAVRVGKKVLTDLEES